MHATIHITSDDCIAIDINCKKIGIYLGYQLARIRIVQIPRNDPTFTTGRNEMLIPQFGKRINGAFVPGELYDFLNFYQKRKLENLKILFPERFYEPYQVYYKTDAWTVWQYAINDQDSFLYFYHHNKSNQ